MSPEARDIVERLMLCRLMDGPVTVQENAHADMRTCQRLLEQGMVTEVRCASPRIRRFKLAVTRPCLEPEPRSAVTVEQWPADQTWTVRYGPGHLDAYYGIIDKGVADLIAIALNKGREIALQKRGVHK